MESAAVHAYLRASLRRGRECEQIGPFLAAFAPASDNPFFNYAIPDDGATASTADVTALIEAYVRRGRKPRLEYVPEVAPAIEPALVAAGFVAEGRLALMGFDLGRATDPILPEGFEIVAPESDEELLGVRIVQHEAYGEPEPPGEANVRSLQANLASGAGAALIRTIDGRDPAGAGEYTTMIDGVTEVTSIGVRPTYRRRGLAAAVTSHLVRAAQSAGATTVFLMANEDEERIYSRVGFTTEATILHISR
jgi:ribosomal protein S18 acetylase RimI-like enzyme